MQLSPRLFNNLLCMHCCSLLSELPSLLGVVSSPFSSPSPTRVYTHPLLCVGSRLHLTDVAVPNRLTFDPSVVSPGREKLSIKEETFF